MPKRLLFGTGLFAFVVFGVWWPAWQPGFIDADAIERLTRIRSFELSTDDPAIYTVVLWVISLGGRSASLATLLQGVAWAGLAGLWAVRLRHLGARSWAAGLVVGVVALLPAVAVGMLGLWPGSLLALATVWVMTELAAGEWTRARTIRTGAALGMLASIGVVGLVAAAVGVSVLLVGEHSPPKEAAQITAVVALGAGLVGWLVLPWAFGMERGRAEVTAVVPIVASALAHHEADLPSEDRVSIDQMAEPALWRNLYDCGDPNALTDDLRFDAEAVSAQRLWALGFGAFVRHPFTAVGQRICASVTLMSPTLLRGTRFYLPPYTIYPNSIGVERNALLAPSLDLTKAILIRTQQTDRLVWWWRPALPIAAAGLTYVLLAIRRRRMALGAALVAGLLAGTFVVGPTPRFETALPLYLAGSLSTTLLVTLRN